MRLRVEAVGEVTRSKEEIKKIVMELTELEMEKDIKLSKVDKTQSKYD